MKLLVKNVECYYNSIKALDSVTFTVKEGDIVGILGPNGSGKTTLLRCISGILKPKVGTVLIDEHYEISSLNPRETAQHIAVVPQETFLNFNFKVLDIVLMGRNPYLSTFRFKFETEHDLEIAYRNMERMGVLHLADRFITDISGGERRRVIIARALTQEPEILLLDEPTTHLDISHQMEIMDLLQQLCLDQKLTVLTVFHDFNLAARYCNKLIMLDKGRIIAQGTVEEVLTEQNLRRVFHVEAKIERHPELNTPYVIPLKVIR